MIVREAVLRYRAMKQPAPEGWSGRIQSSRDVVAYLRASTEGAGVESVYVIALDSKNRPLAFTEVARGGVTQCPFVPADAFRTAIAIGAVSIIVSHYHPSGDPTPSAADRAVTDRLCQAGVLLGLPVLDHVIVTDDLGRFYSFLDAGTLPGR